MMAPMVPRSPLDRLELWEKLRAHVFENHGPAAERAREMAERDWRRVTQAESRVLAALVSLDLDPRLAASWRHARQLATRLGEEASRRGAEMLAESPGVDDSKTRRRKPASPVAAEPAEPTAEQVDRLRKILAWLDDNPPASWLAAQSGAAAAAGELARRGGFESLAAWRWLVWMGYPAAVPDGPRQRWLARLGWMREPGASHRARTQAMEVFDALARATGASLGEVSYLAGVFSGGERDAPPEAALCGARPRCGACPLRAGCVYFGMHGKQQEVDSKRALKALSAELRPRERLMAKGPKGLGDEELLAILLRTGIRGENAVDVARRLITECGSLESMAAMSVAELARQRGVGTVKATQIKAALELARRLQTLPTMPRGLRMSNSRKLFEYVRPRFVSQRQEEFVVLLLNTKFEVMREVPLTRGLVNQVLVHPREAFNEAVRDNAYAVAFAHNHPSGDPDPSQEDDAVTTRLVRAGEIVGILVKDHIIVAGDIYYSYADQGRLGRNVLVEREEPG